jgi:hypothetical protein
MLQPKFGKTQLNKAKKNTQQRRREVGVGGFL